MVKIETRNYDDGIAYGVDIIVNGEIVAAVDVIREDEEIRTLVYKENKDEPFDIVSYNR